MLSDQINAAFDPPAVWDAERQLYKVKCTATPPAHSITIGGMEFKVNPLNMIERVGHRCFSTILGHNDFVLGVPFLRNVVSVFDVGAAEMKFAAFSED